MKNNIKVFLMMLILLIIFSSSVLSDSVSYKSYIYNYWGEPMPSPHAYIPNEVKSGQSLGIDLDKPADLHVSSENDIYVADTGNNRILQLNEKFQIKNKIDKFKINGNEEKFSKPQGVFTDKNQNLYIADSDNNRVVILNKDFELSQIINASNNLGDEEGIVPEDFRFVPRKLAVDEAGRLYVIARDVYEGIMLFNNNKEFDGFIGAPRVAPSPADIIWRRFSTEAQRERTSLFLPTEYSNLDIDEEGFIFTTVAGGEIVEDEPVRKLNPNGEDVLRRNGFISPVGDPPGGLDIDPSRFIDVATSTDGIYSVLDNVRGRIFTYNKNGDLMYVFGGEGNVKGTFQKPVAIDTFKEKLLVLDSRRGDITVFEQTKYALLIHNAIQQYNNGFYEKATALWREVLEYNTNYDLAYTGLGRNHLRRNNFAEAMNYFRLGNNRPGFSESLSFYRRDLIGENFNIIILVLLILLILILILIRINFIEKLWLFITRNERYKNGYSEAAGTAKSQNKFSKKIKRIIQDIGYAFYVISHPFGSFWELKRESAGNIVSASVIFIVTIFTHIFMVQYTGFLFNTRNLNQINIVVEIFSIIIPFILFCIVSWALTTFMEGKGSFREVYIATAYSLTPIVLIFIPTTIVSNFFTLDENTFYYGMLALGLIWSLCLIFSSTLVTHEYDLNTTLVTILFIIIGMGTVIFIGLLFFSLIELLQGFIGDIYREIIFRV